MRINCHTHVFNAKSVFTEKTIHILIDRISKNRLPKSVVDAIAEVIRDLFRKPGTNGLSRDAFRQKLAEKIVKTGKFKAGCELPLGLKAIRPEMTIGPDVANAFLEGLSELLIKDYQATTLSDVIDYLHIAFSDSIDAVTDRLMCQLDVNDITTPLMMDITGPEKDPAEKIADTAQFHQQVLDTSRQILRYPGRFLPFFAVNPFRDEFVNLMKGATSSLGFVGVKLYPSLGYRLTDPDMDKVFDHCDENAIPITMHCNLGGFKDGEGAANCDPAIVRPILEARSKLRFNFAHFGGDENLASKTIPAKSYTNKIVQMMKTPGLGSRVFADISYHTEPMGGRNAKGRYQANIQALLNAGEPTATQILWGSDYWMVRMRLRECNYWPFFMQLLGPSFKQISEVNPLSFLGFMFKSGGRYVLASNLVKHVEYVYANVDKLQSKPTPWLMAALLERDAGLKPQLDILPEMPPYV